MKAPLVQVKGPLVNAEWVGVFSTVGQTIEDRDGNALSVDTDINAKVYAPPMPGPIADLKKGLNRIRWRWLRSF